jgi:hypothetical protein
MKQLAERLGWTLHAVQDGEPDAPDGAPFEIIWISVDQKSAIHWIEDHLLQVNYIGITGPSRAQTEVLLRDVMEIHSPDSMTDLFDSARDADSLMNSVRMLSIQCQEDYNPQLFALLRWAANDPSPIVRRVTLLTASTINWAEIDPLVQYVHDHDADETVRAEAAEVLSIIRSRAARAATTDESGGEE